MLRVEHIAKSFGPITALRDVNLHLNKGEVLGLLGDNGSGKSTLIKIICGFHKAGPGSDVPAGRAVRAEERRRRAHHGIDTVYQDLALVDELTRHQNMFLRRERLRQPLPFLNNGADAKATRARRSTTSASTSRRSTCPSRGCPEGQRQAIAVARTISGSEADILLLDEPLAAMGAKEGGLILELIERLKEEGEVSIIMILHNYVHVLAPATA